MTLLAVAAGVTWWPIAAGVRAASVRRFAAEIVELDAAERTIARRTAAALSIDLRGQRLLGSATDRAVVPPAGVRLTQMLRWDASRGRWTVGERIVYARSGHSDTYAIRYRAAGDRSAGLLILGITGQTMAIGDQPLPLWGAGR